MSSADASSRREYQKTMQDRADEAHGLAIRKGWWPDEDQARAELLDPELVASKLALVHSEVSEALEAIRAGTCEEFAEELADVVIRVFDLAGACGISIEDEVARKHAKNQTRPHRHGGKRL